LKKKKENSSQGLDKKVKRFLKSRSKLKGGRKGGD